MTTFKRRYKKKLTRKVLKSKVTAAASTSTAASTAASASTGFGTGTVAVVARHPPKRLVTDDELGAICSTGQFSTYQGNFYRPDNIKKFQKVAAEFKERYKESKKESFTQRYKKFLNDRFSTRSGVNAKAKVDMLKNDFFTYVNADWMKNTGVDSSTKYYVQIDNFRIKQEEVYYKLVQYINDYVKANPKEKKAIAIKNMYASLTNDTTDKFKTKTPAIVNELESFILKDDPLAYIAEINKSEITKWGCPIVWSMSPDEKNVLVYKSHISFVTLPIYDYMIYIDDTSAAKDIQAYRKSVKSHYFKYIRETFDACLGTSQHPYKPEHVWEVEIALMQAMGGCGKDIAKYQKNVDFYNVMTEKDILQLCDFDWTHFATSLGFKKHDIPKSVIVSSPNSLTCVVKLVKENWKTPQWKTYWLYIQFRQMTRFETTLRHIHYDFYNKFLEGQPIIMPKEIYPIFGMSMTFNTFLSEEYAKHNYNALYVNYTKKLVADLMALYIQIIEKNTWLSPSTKKYALFKLKKMKVTVGLPAKLREDPLFDYRPDDPLRNIGLLLQWKHKRYVALEGQPIIDIPVIDWQKFKLSGTQCYIVNAFYASNSNSIYIPLGMLQEPFIDLNERGLEHNLVYIGYTLGHELSHSLDNTGSRYDEVGNLKNWWTPEDHKTFLEKQKDVTKQYEEFAARDGIHFDASIGVGENLADISGFALIEQYLMDNQLINDEITLMKKINLMKLYINIAIQGRQKLSQRAIKAQLKMNPHPLDKYRVNCPLARLQLFRTIFNIKKGDGMWWHNTDTIW